MNVTEVRELLPIYADGELDAARSVEIERHLRDSADLRDELERWKALRRCLHRAVFADSAPPGLRESILASLPGREARVIRFRPARWLGGITAAAAAVAILFFLIQPNSVTAEPTEIVADRFMDIYRQCAVKHRHNGMNIDVSDFDKARVQLASSSSDATLVPDLRSSGFEIGGACRCFKSNGATAIHVFYSRKQPTPAVVSVFSVDRKIHVKDCRCERCMCSAGICRNYEVVNENNLVVYKWDEESNSYAVCSDLPAEELRHLTDGVTLAKLRTVMDDLVSAGRVDSNPVELGRLNP